MRSIAQAADLVCLLTSLLCISQDSTPNFVEGTVTRYERQEGVEIRYDVLLEKAIVGPKEHEGKKIGPITCNLRQGSSPPRMEPPAGCKVGAKYIWLVDVTARGEAWIRDPLSSNAAVRDALKRLAAGIDATRERDHEKARQEFLSLLKSHSAIYFYSTVASAAEAKADAMTTMDSRRILGHVFSALQAFPSRDGKSELEYMAYDESLPLEVRLLCLYQYLAFIPHDAKTGGKGIPDLFVSLVKQAKTASDGAACGEIFRLFLSRKPLWSGAVDRFANAAKIGLDEPHPAEFRRAFAGGVYAWDLPAVGNGLASPVTDAFLEFLLGRLEQERDEQTENLLMSKMPIFLLNESQLKTTEATLPKLSSRAQAKIAKEIAAVRNSPKIKGVQNK